MAKKVCLYGILSAICIVLGYVEHFLTPVFIAPGIKLGFSNAVVLLLVLKRDIKGAFLVNIARILLSALLFSSPSVLLYSLPAGVFSVSGMAVISNFKVFGTVGFSIIGALLHNITQLFCALYLLGSGVLYYAPALLISALVSGVVIGMLGNLIFKKISI